MAATLQVQLSSAGSLEKEEEVKVRIGKKKEILISSGFSLTFLFH